MLDFLGDVAKVVVGGVAKSLTDRATSSRDSGSSASLPRADYTGFMNPQMERKRAMEDSRAADVAGDDGDILDAWTRMLSKYGR